MAKFFKLLILVPIAIVILAFAIANRQTVSISLDPFSNPETSDAVIRAPLFIVMFLLLIVGTFIGGVATWFTQGTNRRKAQLARDDAEKWRDEAVRLGSTPFHAPGPPGRALAHREL